MLPEATTTASSETATAPAWWQRPYRMVQTNLRQPDALYDQKALAKEIRAFGADVLLYNIGGIYAFYPTKLPLHAINPYMKGDALGDAIEAAHSEGLSLVGRFDMSKATRIAYEAHPDWFVHNGKGDPLGYNGTYQACVNGGWYQDYALEIISESLGQYDVDNVFFNMFGYRNSNYSGDYFGICECDNCVRRFREMYGKPLPRKEDFSDPSYADYLEFKDRTSLELRSKCYRQIKQVNPKVAVTGHRGDSDLIRLEVQRAVDRPQPEWPYQAGEQAKWGRAYGRGKTVSSTSTNFVDYAWRFASETGAYHLLRFAQQLGSGATLDFYLLGVLDQDDKKAFAQVSDLYHWHAAHEADYAGLDSAAAIGLYQSRATDVHRGRTRTAGYGAASFRGAYRALVEARLPFDFVCDELVPEDALDGYAALVMPNVACLSDAEATAIDAWVAAGGVLLATGETGFYDERGVKRDAPALASLPVAGMPSMRRDLRGAYFRIRDGELPLPETKLLMIDGPYHDATPKDGAERLLSMLPPQRFGPPELCFPDVDGDAPGAIIGRHGKGTVVYLPWHPDALYHRDSLPDTRTLIADLLTRHLGPAPARLEGRGSLELTVQRQPDKGRILVHVINYGGQRNNLYEDPAAVHGLRLCVRGVAGPGTALVAGTEIAPESAAPDPDGYHWYALPPLEAFEAIAFTAAR
jgi:hypothetical protein